MAAEPRWKSWANRLLGAAVAGPLVVVLLVLTSTLWIGGRVRDIRTTPIILQQVQALSRLETARQSSHQVVKAASENPVLGELLSKDELTFVAVVQTTAGVDLAKLAPGDVAVHGQRVTILLPPAEVFAVTIDEAASEVVAREQGLLNFRADKDLEGEARREATSQARAAALRQGLLSEAQANAETALRKLLAQLGYDDVQFVAERG